MNKIVALLLACLIAAPAYANNTRRKGEAFSTRFLLFDAAGAPVSTGTPVVTINGVASTNAASFATGYWSLLLTTSEANADEVVVLADHPDGEPVLLTYGMFDPVKAYEDIGLASANLDTQLGNIDDHAESAANSASAAAGDAASVEERLTVARAGYIDSLNTGVPLADGAITAAKFGANAIAASTLASDVTTELQSGLLTSSAFDAKVGTPDVDLSADIAAIEAGTGGDPVSPDVVGDSYTWFGKRYRASNIVEVESGYVGPLALAPDMNPGVTITTVDSVSIVSGMTTVVATDLSVDRSRTRAVFTVPALSTEATYTVRVKVTTVEGQEITTVCTLKVY